MIINAQSDRKTKLLGWFVKDVWPMVMLLLKTAIIILLYYFADFLYHLYNSFFQPASLLDWNLSFFVVVLGVLLLGNRILRNLGLGLITLTVVFTYFHFQYFGNYVQPISFFLIDENISEIFLVFGSEVRTMVLPFLIAVSIHFLVLLVGNLDVSKVDLLKSTVATRLGLIILGGLFCLGFLVTWLQMDESEGRLNPGLATRLWPNPKLHSAENFYRSFSYFIVAIVPQKLFLKPKNIFPLLEAPRKLKENPQVNIIVVIGESMRSQNLSVLGYDGNDTAPELSKISKEKLYSSSIYAAGTMTKTAISSFMNRTPFPGMTEQMSAQKNCLFNLAKQSGFSTHFYSSQEEEQLGILSNYLCGRFLDHYESRTSFGEKNKDIKKYDNILKQMVRDVDFSGQPQFVILHQRGSHSPYKMNYPEEFQRFESDYDNSIAYTSHLLADLFSDIKSRTNKKTYIIYTSDHGELLGEHNMHGHGWFFPEVYRVPFLFYVINDELSNLPLANIRSHFGVSNLITRLLGFDVEIVKRNEVYVNGSDINGFSGYLRIVIDEGGKEISKEEFH